MNWLKEIKETETLENQIRKNQKEELRQVLSQTYKAQHMEKNERVKHFFSKFWNLICRRMQNVTYKYHFSSQDYFLCD